MKQEKILPAGAVLPPMIEGAIEPPTRFSGGTDDHERQVAKAAPRAAGKQPPASVRGTPKGVSVKAHPHRHTDRFGTMNDFVDFTMRSLTPREAQAWFVLYRDTRPNGFAKTGLSDMATRLGCSVATAKRTIKRLRDRGLVERVRRGAPGYGPNTYHVVGVSSAVPETSAAADHSPMNSPIATQADAVAPAHSSEP